MNPWMKWILLATPIALSGCRASTVAPIGAVNPGGGEGGPMLAQGQGDVAYEGPPHSFSPRPHPPRTRTDPPPPDLARLPKLVLRLDQCYAPEREAQVASPKSGGSSRRGGGPAKPKPTYKGVQYQGGAGSSALGGSAGPGTASGGITPYQPSPPPSATPSAPAAEPRPVETAEVASKSRVTRGDSAGAADEAPNKKSLAEKRKDRQEERKRDRAADKSASSAPLAAEGEAPADGDDLAYQAPSEAPREAHDDWGAAVYLSNDDTMSLSSAQRVMFAIDKFLPVPIEHIRPHELLNYFSFETAQVLPSDDFSVLPEIAPDPKQPGIYNLALAIRGRPVDKQSRRNAGVTFVVDRSGSMSDEGRMDYLKRGMQRMISELKTGDLVNVVLFDHEVCAPVENFVVGRDRVESLTRAIERMQPRGSTDVHAGLTRGYELADRAYQPTYNNRVVLVTDALANTGVTDARTMSMVTKYYDQRKIRLSGVGVGTEFNDALLDKLTERGKGAYVFLGSPAEVDAVFGQRFISLLETTAMDVHFQLHLPPSLRMNVFYGEESSVVKEDVQAIHYFANTSQLFLSDLMARGGELRPQDQIMLTIEYEDPETGQAMLEERAFTLGEIAHESYNLRKGRLLIGWADRLALLASRPQPVGYGPTPGAWMDEDGYAQCEKGKGELRELSQGMNDPEVNRVMALWDKFCARYEQPRNPVRRVPAAQPDAWPGASGS